MIEAANAEEEALAIAVALREAIETKNKTAALVTPDRALARRVVAALERWQVDGRRLRRRFTGRHAGRRVREAGGGSSARRPRAGDAAGAAQASAAAARRAAGAHSAAIATLERALLRGPRPRPGSDGLAHALSTFRANRDELHRSDPRWLIADDEFDVAAELVARLGAALAPLERLKAGDHPLAALATWHRDVIAALDPERRHRAFAGDDTTRPRLRGTHREPDRRRPRRRQKRLCRTVPRHRRRPDVKVRRRISDRRARAHLRPLEARLLTFDRVVLGGLNEGTWPPETRNDPWLSRPMRRDLGLDPPERRIGLSAHDFAQALGAREVILARAAKVAGSPTVTSRFVQRIAALAGEARWDEALARGNIYLELAARARSSGRGEIRRTSGAEAETRGAAAAAVGHGHRGLAARSLHHLRQIYSPPAAARCGRHAARRARPRHRHPRRHRRLHRRCSPPSRRPIRCKELLALGEKHFAPLADYPEARAFWWPRFLRIAHWFAQWDSERRAGLASAACGNQRRAEIPDRQTRVHALGHRRPHRAAPRRQLRHPRLQDRRGAHRKAGAHGPRAAIDAGSRHLARRRLQDHRRRLGVGNRLRHAERRRAGRQAERDRLQGRHARQPGRPRAGAAEGAGGEIRGRSDALSLARAPDVETHYGDYDHLARVKEWSASAAGRTEGSARS